MEWKEIMKIWENRKYMECGSRIDMHETVRRGYQNKDDSAKGDGNEGDCG